MDFMLQASNIRVLGSMHWLPEARTALPSWVRLAYEWAEDLVFESDPTLIWPPSMIALTEDSAEQSLLVSLPYSQHSALAKNWPGDRGLPALGRAKPWAVLLFMPGFLQGRRPGVEPHFAEWAKADGKRIEYLETFEEVARIADAVSPSVVLDSLGRLADDLEAPQRSIEEMHEHWIARDLAGVSEVFDRSPVTGSPEIRAALLTARNKLWASKIQGRLNSPQRTLIVVGALHLFGEGSLLEQIGREFVLV